MRVLQRFRDISPPHWVLLGVSLIWGYTVLRSGAAATSSDWDFCVLALGGLAIVSALFLRAAEDMPSLGAGLRWPLRLLPCYVALQAIPLPVDLIRILSPARAALAKALSPVLGGIYLTPISIKSDITWEHLLRVLVYILVFLLIRRVGARLSANPWITALPIVAVAVLEAVLGIVQYAGDPVRNVAQGTYVDRNHFAGLLEMSFPFALMFPVSVLLRSSATWMSEMRTAAKVGLGFAAAVTILLGIMRSLSRTGFVAALFSLLVMSVLTLRHMSGRPRRIALLSAIGTAVVTLVIFPPTRLLARFEALKQYGGMDSGIDRYILLTQGLRVFASYLLTGCGLGGYQYAWLKYKTELPLWAADFVHNDYLQLLVELGVAGAAILAVLLITLLIRVMRGTSPAVPAESRHVAIACVGGNGGHSSA